jgi:hypothetical protein
MRLTWFGGSTPVFTLTHLSYCQNPLFIFKWSIQVDLPPPLGPIEFGPVGQAFMFCIAILLLVSLVLPILPRQWLRRIVQVAFRLRRDEEL